MVDRLEYRKWYYHEREGIQLCVAVGYYSCDGCLWPMSKEKTCYRRQGVGGSDILLGIDVIQDLIREATSSEIAQLATPAQWAKLADLPNEEE